MRIYDESSAKRRSRAFESRFTSAGAITPRWRSAEPDRRAIKQTVYFARCEHRLDGRAQHAERAERTQYPIRLTDAVASRRRQLRDRRARWRRR